MFEEFDKKLGDAQWHINYHVKEIEKLRKNRDDTIKYLVGLIKKAYKPETEIDARTIADIQEAIKDKILEDNYKLSQLDFHKKRLAEAHADFNKALKEGNNNE